MLSTTADDVCAQVPIHVNIREGSDAGQPVVISQPQSPAALAFDTIAKRVLDKLEQDPSTPPLPDIKVEA